MRIPYNEIKKYRYPCVNNRQRFIMIITIIMVLFCLVISIKLWHSNYFFEFLFISIFTLIIMFLLMQLFFYITDYKFIDRLFTSIKRCNIADLWRIIEYQRGAAISKVVLQTPKNFYLIAMLLLFDADAKNDTDKRKLAQSMVDLACSYDPNLSNMDFATLLDYHLQNRHIKYDYLTKLKKISYILALIVIVLVLTLSTLMLAATINKYFH